MMKWLINFYPGLKKNLNIFQKWMKKGILCRHNFMGVELKQMMKMTQVVSITA